MNFKQKKIVYFVPSMEGGIGRVTSLLASGMLEKGFNVEVWSAAPQTGEGFDEDVSVPIKIIGTGSIRSAFFPLIQKFRENQLDLVISASFHANCLILLTQFILRTSIGFVIVDHPSIDSALQELSILKRAFWKLLIRFLYPIADIHIAVSAGVRNAMAKFGGINLSQIVVIPNPVITNKMFADCYIPIDHPFFVKDGPKILFVGRLSPEKDVSNLIYAFKRIQEQLPSWLIIVGDGPERVKLERLAFEKGISGRVSFVGHKKNPYPYFIQSDLLALSSTREGLPTVLIEALAFDLKVVSTDCPSGPREILNDGAFGMLVRPSDSVALSDAMISSITTNRPLVQKGFLKKYKVQSAVNKYIETLSSNL